MGMFQSTKQFGHDLGISCAFRQWRATHSHCSQIHGYALAFKFTFQAAELDERNWVQDFGGLKRLKGILMDMFDHKLVVAQDDPNLSDFKHLHQKGIANVVILPSVGCEAFAKIAFEIAQKEIPECDRDRITLLSVEVKEHGANSAIYMGA